MASLSEFRGFSDREINSIHQEKPSNVPLEVENPPRQAEFGKNLTRGPRRQNYIARPDLRPQTDSVPLPSTAFIVQKSQVSTTATNPDQSEPNQSNEGHTLPSSQDDDKKDFEESDEKMLDLTAENNATAESNLELLQKQQKELEKENKKKKALVEQTLQQRYARSQLEAKTLQSVKEELARLDSLLSRDVVILRNRIEEATRQYSSARKRYESAEKEFVAAKIALHRASESKELLSEHLCTIIQKNEVLKAEKLAELLKTLELENGDNSTTDSAAQIASGGVLFHKTPTPGANIWPHERRDSSSKEDTGSRDAKEDTI